LSWSIFWSRRERPELSNLVNICYIRQKEQLGLGHAVLATRTIIGDEAFAVILPDDIIDSETPALKQMMEVYEQYGNSVVAVEQVSPQDTTKYGIIEPERIAERLYQVLSMVEKPEPPEAPSNLGIVGRYILTPGVFTTLSATRPGKGREIQLTDALQLLLDSEVINAVEFRGVRYDTGNPLGWLKATISLALKHPDIGSEVRTYLRQILDR
jgi:UTP--glucose-1-phosphate uridylyltransferase